MKNLLYFFFSLIVIYSCSRHKVINDTGSSKTEILAKGNDSIDVDLKYFRDTAYINNYDEIPKDVIIKIRAVIYRIYSNVLTSPRI